MLKMLPIFADAFGASHICRAVRNTKELLSKFVMIYSVCNQQISNGYLLCYFSILLRPIGDSFLSSCKSSSDQGLRHLHSML
jgi:hypothetical protein